MKYNFVRNAILASLVVTGVGLWGNAASDLSATVNTSSGASSGSITGSFATTGYDNPTIITSLGSIYDLSPLNDSTIDFTVIDMDGMSGYFIEVRLFHSNSDQSINLETDENSIDGFNYTEYEGNPTLDALYDAHPATTNDGEAFVLRQKSSPTNSDFFEVVYDDGVNASNVSWVLNSSSRTENSLNSHSFSLSFKTSKVAKFASSGEWSVGVRVLENADRSNVLTEYFYTSLDVSWYGEIVIPAGLSASFTGTVGGVVSNNIEVGSDYANNTEVLENIVFISNGRFDQLIGTDSTWTSDKLSSDNTTPYYGYVADSSSDLTLSQYFHLVVSNEPVASSHGSLQTVDNGGFAYTEVSTQEGTVESGLSLNYYLYLKTSEEFQNGTYTGTIYLGIQQEYLPS
jgi:hypothetical protein